MRRGVVIAIAVGGALVGLFAWAGWRFIETQRYEKNFKMSFVENCAMQIEAHGTSAQDRHRKVEALCQCSADAIYEDIKNVPVPEQYAQLATPEMKQKLGDTLKTCAQKVGLQLGNGNQ